MLIFSLTKIGIFSLLFTLKIHLGFSQFTNNTQVLAIADDIRNLRFASAQDEILNNKQINAETLAAIIHHVYSKTANNTKLILDFAHDVESAGLSFHTLKALKNEMAANNHSDPLKLISLYRAFEDDVIFKRNTRPNISPDLQKILDELKADVKASAKQILKTSLFANDIEENVFVQNVTSALFNFFYEINDEVMKELANETYPQVPAVELLNSLMFGSRYIPQQITFFLALYEQLELNNDLNNEAVLKLAFFFRVLKKRNNYANLFRPKKYAVNEVIRRMPICARNLYFAENLCIWNRGREEYLYADMSQHNLSRRGIFTYPAEDITDGGLWKVVLYRDLYFQSLIYPKEYLYASTTDKYNLTTRHVLTWVDDGFVGDTSAWKVELSGDYCFIKNINFEEYLYTSDRIHAEKKRFVFTATRGTETLDQPDFQWQIRNCGT